eukprot:924459-Alexandrium_andersonii.AAC.1
MTKALPRRAGPPTTDHQPHLRSKTRRADARKSRPLGCPRRISQSPLARIQRSFASGSGCPR